MLVLQNLTQLMPEATQLRTGEFAAQWRQNWSRLGEDDASVAAIDSAIAALREDVLTGLKALD